MTTQPTPELPENYEIYPRELAEKFGAQPEMLWRYPHETAVWSVWYRENCDDTMESLHISSYLFALPIGTIARLTAPAISQPEPAESCLLCDDPNPHAHLPCPKCGALQPMCHCPISQPAWLPIEQAPRDGTPVEVTWMPHHPGTVREVTWYNDCWVGSTGFRYTLHPPTHFRPISQPAKEGGDASCQVPDPDCNAAAQESNPPESPQWHNPDHLPTAGEPPWRFLVKGENVSKIEQDQRWTGFIWEAVNYTAFPDWPKEYEPNEIVTYRTRRPLPNTAAPELLPCPFCGMPGVEEDGVIFCDNHKCADVNAAPEIWNHRTPTLAPASGGTPLTKDYPAHESQIQAFAQGTINHIASEVSHDLRCATDDKNGIDRIRWNNRCVGGLLRTLHEERVSTEQLETRLSSALARLGVVEGELSAVGAALGYRPGEDFSNSEGLPAIVKAVVADKHEAEEQRNTLRAELSALWAERDAANQGYEGIRKAHAAYIQRIRDMLGMKEGEGFINTLDAMKQEHDQLRTALAEAQADGVRLRERYHELLNDALLSRHDLQQRGEDTTHFSNYINGLERVGQEFGWDDPDSINEGMNKAVEKRSKAQKPEGQG